MKKSLLVVAPRYPYPIVGGDRIRIYYICQALAEHFDLTLLSFCETKSELHAPLPNDSVFKKIERVYLPKWKSWINCLLALKSDRPLQVAYYTSKFFSQRINELAKENDGVFFHLIRTTDIAEQLHCPKFLEMTDAISLNYSRINQSTKAYSGISSFIYRLEEPRLRDYEKSIIKIFDHTFLVSEMDRQFIFNNNPSARDNVSIVTNGVDLERSPYAFSPEGKDLVFIGNMTTLPNMDAVEYLAREILPKVRMVHPSTRLRVIGRIGAKERFRLEQLEYVRIVGEVDSVSMAARGGGAGVCPMRLGAGIQNKLLEYMALGLPSVSSTIGLEGLSARPGLELQVADEPETFSRHLIDLLSDRTRAEAMAVLARNYVAAHHSWKIVSAPMVQTINDCLEAADQPARVAPHAMDKEQHRPTD